MPWHCQKHRTGYRPRGQPGCRRGRLRQVPGQGLHSARTRAAAAAAYYGIATMTCRHDIDAHAIGPGIACGRPRRHAYAWAIIIDRAAAPGLRLHI